MGRFRCSDNHRTRPGTLGKSLLHPCQIGDRSGRDDRDVLGSRIEELLLAVVPERRLRRSRL